MTTPRPRTAAALLGLLLLPALAPAAAAQDAAVAATAAVDSGAAPPRPTRVAVGVLLRRIDALDLKAGSASVTFYVWTRWQGPADGAAFEVRNGRLEQKDAEFREEKDGFRYAYYRCQATVHLHVDFRAFPFDEHLLSLELEHPELAEEDLVYVPDLEGMKYLDSPPTSGWVVGPPSYEVTTRTYRTNWGMIGASPEESTRFSSFRASVVLKHEPGATLVKTFLPLAISMLITFLAFLVHPEELEARVGVGVAGIFGVVTSQAVNAENLPEISYMTLADKLHTASLLFVFMTLLATACAGQLVRREEVARAVRLDRVAGSALTLGYAALVALLLLLSP